MRKQIISTLILVFLVSVSAGCMKMAAGMAGIPSSKYSPLLFAEKDYKDFIESVKPVVGSMVQDELGDYYFKLTDNDGYLKRLAIKKDELENVRQLFTKGTGLVEPIYEFDTNLNIKPNWELTEKLRSELVKVGFVNILPIAQSKKYHELLIAKIDKDIADSMNAAKTKNFGNAFGATEDAFSGERRAYNSDYYANVLSKFAGKATYLLTSDQNMADTYKMAKGILLNNQEARRNALANPGIPAQAKEQIRNENPNDIFTRISEVIDMNTASSYATSSVKIVNIDMYKGTQKAGLMDVYIFDASTANIEKQLAAYKKAEEAISVSKAMGRGFSAQYAKKSYDEGMNEARKEFAQRQNDARKNSREYLMKNMEFLKEVKDMLKISGSQKSKTVEN